jgi:hypothetical protein
LAFSPLLPPPTHTKTIWYSHCPFRPASYTVQNLCVTYVKLWTWILTLYVHCTCTVPGTCTWFLSYWTLIRLYSL